LVVESIGPRARVGEICELRGAGAPLPLEIVGFRDGRMLSVAPHVRLPGGEPCFPGVPARTPQQILAAHGLRAGQPQMLDAANEVSVTPWRRDALE
jgi:hypothetical protein